MIPTYVLLPVDRREKIEKLADAENRSMSGMIRELIDEALKQRAQPESSDWVNNPKIRR